MAGFFGRSGGGSSNSNSNASANRGQGGGSSYGDNSNNANDYSGGQSHNQSSFGSGGGNIYGSDLQGDYNNNQRGGGGGAGYGSNANTGAGSMARSGSNTETASSVGTGSRFGSINDENMDRASISTFGGGTSVASGSDYQKPSGQALSLGGIANELMNRDESSNGGNNRGIDNQHLQSGGMQSGGNQGYSQGSQYGGNQQQQQGGQSTPQASYGMDNNDNNRADSFDARGSSDHNGSQSTVQSSNNVPQTMGTSNASAFETTDHSNFVDSDPIAIAADFNSETAEIIFLSAEAGQGANRQPVTKFRIHEVNLNVHSNVLSELADTEDDDDDSNGTNGNADRTPIHLEEDAATLKLLFGLMYNRSSPPLTMSDWQVVLRMARAAQKYDCARAKEVAAAYFTEQEQLGALSPFMTYAFAVQYKLQALEESAAERSVRYDIHRLPELVFGMMGFAAYQKLSAFHARRQTHYQDVLNNISMDPKELADQCYQTGGICVVGPWQKLKTKLAWPRQTGRDGSRRPPEPTDVLRKVVTEIGQIDCGTCAKALCEGAMQAQLALTSMPSYNEAEEDSF